MSRKKKKRSIAYRDVELNIMPFIDVFSMLNTFLLFTAVFVTIGITEVQIPFITNAPPPKEQKSNRFLNINIDVSKEKIEVVRVWSAPPADEMKWEFTNDKDGVLKMHQRLVSLRREDPDTDKVTVFCEDDVIFKEFSKILDGVKLRFEGDPMFTTKAAAEVKDKKAAEESTIFLYPKIVIGSVIL